MSNNLKQIFILGAGSSISHDNSFPSINDFFPKGKEVNLEIKKDFPELYKYIFENFGIDVTSAENKVNIEKVFTILEIGIERSNDPSLQIIRSQILKLIQLLLGRITSRVKADEGDLNQFAKKLGESDTVITFNWDITLDDLIGRKNILKWIYEHDKFDSRELQKNCYWNFIYKLSVHGENTSDGLELTPPYSEWNNKNGYFLKMHGSTDWAFCSNELCKAHGKGFIVKEIEQELYCSSCHEPVYPLIVPPVLNKQYRKYHLIRRVWNTALKEIESSKELIIWGYSLPETDFYSAWLFRNARQTIKRLTLINPSVIKGKKEKKINNAFVNHFVNIFKGKLKKDSIILYENFKDYMIDVNVHGKYGINS
ncbi:MAG: hypothetical protein HY754_12570 [Nitrospirae bacterium]|nr:hypothetical protein [Nitrospirota bacterium]